MDIPGRSADLDGLKRRITVWAGLQPEIRVALVVGSQVRKSSLADNGADLDLHLYCTDFERLVSHVGWLESLGEVWTWLPEEIAPGVPQVLALFEGGLKVDFTFLSVEVLQGFIARALLDEVHSRGFVALLDKDGLAGRLPTASCHPPQRVKPSEEAFRQVVNTFFYGAVSVAKQIRRRNLWVVKFRDWTMKEPLLRVMEWYGQVQHGPDYDTVFDGHFLADWVGEETWADIHLVFGAFDASASWQTLFETLRFFRRLATQTTLLWGYEYPSTLDRRVSKFVQNLYQQDSPG